MSTCNCGGTERLIFSCSGAADVGELSDRVARKLAKDGKGKLFCLAVAGAKIEEKIAPMRSQAAVAIDGCGMLCAKKCSTTQVSRHKASISDRSDSKKENHR